MNRFFFVIIFVGISLGALVAWVSPSWVSGGEKESAGDWHTQEFQNFELSVPEKFSLEEKDSTLFVFHSIPFEHEDPCNFSGNSQKLSSLMDFQISLELINKSFRDTILEKEPEAFVKDYLVENVLKEEKGFIEKAQYKDFEGYRIRFAVEHCGLYAYYFPISEERTLVIQRLFIPEFSIPAFQKDIQELPGIIQPENEEAIFQEIMNSLLIFDSEKKMNPISFFERIHLY